MFELMDAQLFTLASQCTSHRPSFGSENSCFIRMTSFTKLTLSDSTIFPKHLKSNCNNIFIKPVHIFYKFIFCSLIFESAPVTSLCSFLQKWNDYASVIFANISFDIRPEFGFTFDLSPQLLEYLGPVIFLDEFTQVRPLFIQLIAHDQCYQPKVEVSVIKDIIIWFFRFGQFTIELKETKGHHLFTKKRFDDIVEQVLVNLRKIK